MVRSAPTVFAQEEETQKLERIEITGSRIKPVGAESSSPIASAGKEHIDVKQPLAIAELLCGLPAACSLSVGRPSPSIDPTVSNGAIGTATIDLPRPGLQPHAGADQRPPQRAA